MHLPRLYTDLASWWHLLSDPADYEEEASIFRHALDAEARRPIEEVLELGSGGGNAARYLKRWYRMTLVDVAPAMLEASAALHPECEHVEGDMRSVRLGRSFDAVYVGDAVAYMTTEDDLRSAMETAFLHCRPGGVALFVPDDTVETWQPFTKHGGYDQGARSLRYLEWSYDPDPDDARITTIMAYLMKDGDASVEVVRDEHVLGLFPRDTWLGLLESVGFHPLVLPFRHTQLPEGTCELFLGRREG